MTDGLLIVKRNEYGLQFLSDDGEVRHWSNDISDARTYFRIDAAIALCLTYGGDAVVNAKTNETVYGR